LTDGAIANSEPDRQILGEFNNYAGLQELLRARAEQLQLTREQIDEISGLQNGYASKLLSPRPVKKLGAISMPLMLATLAMKLVAVADPGGLERISRRGFKRKISSAVRGAAVQFTFSRPWLRKIGRKGGENSRKNLSPRQRRALARKAAHARWQRFSPDAARQEQRALARKAALARWRRERR
jgi:hypothetical protein